MAFMAAVPFDVRSRRKPRRAEHTRRRRLLSKSWPCSLKIMAVILGRTTDRGPLLRVTDPSSLSDALDG